MDLEGLAGSCGNCFDGDQWERHFLGSARVFQLDLRAYGLFVDKRVLWTEGRCFDGLWIITASNVVGCCLLVLQSWQELRFDGLHGFLSFSLSLFALANTTRHNNGPNPKTSLNARCPQLRSTGLIRNTNMSPTLLLKFV